jgi:hypothetical protein
MKDSFGTVGVSVEVRSKYLLDRSQEHCMLTYAVNVLGSKL